MMEMRPREKEKSSFVGLSVVWTSQEANRNGWGVAKLYKGSLTSGRNGAEVKGAQKTAWGPLSRH